MKKIRYIAFFFAPIMMMNCAFSDTQFSTPPSIPAGIPSPNGVPGQLSSTPNSTFSQTQTNPTSTQSMGIISYPTSQGQQPSTPYPSQPSGAYPSNQLSTPYPSNPQDLTRKQEPIQKSLVSPALDQELAAQGLEAKKLFAVIENNKIYLVGPKPKPKKKKR